MWQACILALLRLFRMQESTRTLYAANAKFLRHGAIGLSCLLRQYFGGSTAIICQFMKGACRLRPVVKSLVPSWDLSIVLKTTSQQPLEPLDTVDMRFLSLKTAFLLGSGLA